MIRCVGIDPGSSCGIVALELPDSGQMARARWVGYATVHPSAALTGAPRQRDFRDRIGSVLAGFRPSLIVLEEPVDAKPFWSGKRKGGRREGTGTAFRVGVAYMAALAGTPPEASVVSYPVQKFEGRAGWMPKTRAEAIVNAVRVARVLHAPDEFFTLSQDGSYLREDCFMALGVLSHHVSVAWPRRLRATLKSMP